MEPCEGQEFASFSEVKDYLEEYGRVKFVKFWVRSSHTIDNLKSSAAKKINPELKYSCMKFACIYGGEKIRCRGSGIRRSTTYRNLGCPCSVRAVVKPSSNCVTLDTVNLEHNHPLSKSLYDTIKKSRKTKLNDDSNMRLQELKYKKTNLEIKPYSEIAKMGSNSQVKKITTNAKECINGNSEDYLQDLKNKYGSNVKIIVVDENRASPKTLTSDDELENASMEESQLCRLCLCSDGNMSPIFDANSSLQSTLLSLKIMACASIEVLSDDGLPSNICTTCEATLDIAYQFRIQCENADSTLRRDNLKSSKSTFMQNMKLKKEPDVSIKENGLSMGQSILLWKAPSGENVVSVDEGLGVKLESNADHVESQESVLNLFCPVCSDVFESYPDLQLHLPAHSQEENIQCNMCDTVCENDVVLSQHIAEHFEPEVEWGDIVSCSTCNLVFSSREELLEHVETHLEPDPQRDESSPEPPAVVDELREERTLTKIKNFLCTVCGKILRDKERYESHRNSHEGLRPHVCSQCGKGFADRKNLHQHFETVHLRKAPHECPVCKKKFYTPAKMKTHLTMHYGIKPFSCDVCQKTFRLRMNLMKHKKTHTNQRPHQCNKCPAAFIDKNMLKRHSYIHGGVRPYPCPICGHRFAVKFHLKKHMEKNKCRASWVPVEGQTAALDSSQCLIVYEEVDPDTREGGASDELGLEILDGYNTEHDAVQDVVL